MHKTLSIIIIGLILILNTGRACEVACMVAETGQKVRISHATNGMPDVEICRTSSAPEQKAHSCHGDGTKKNGSSFKCGCCGSHEAVALYGVSEAAPEIAPIYLSSSEITATFKSFTDITPAPAERPPLA